MAQPSVKSFFISRKRGIEDDLIAQRKKVICLEKTRNASESQASEAESEDEATIAVFPKTLDNYSLNDDDPKKVARAPKTIRQGITPQRLTRSKKVHMQEVDGIEAPKIVNFWKGGNLSPQKKSKGTPTETVTKADPEPKSSDEVSSLPGTSAPVKNNAPSGTLQNDTVEMTPLIFSNTGGIVSKLDEIKKKLKGSSRLAELKTSLNKLNEGIDKRELMEKKRIASGPVRSEASAETTKSLKPFKSIELEILR